MTRHQLHNRFGWVLTYEVAGQAVTVRRTYRGGDVGSVVMGLAAARRHWQGQQAAGFVRMS